MALKRAYMYVKRKVPVSNKNRVRFLRKYAHQGEPNITNEMVIPEKKKRCLNYRWNY